ncbi:MAG: hypothetical protein DMF06_10750, partial [Verrucomicrobia bacterium]
TDALCEFASGPAFLAAQRAFIAAESSARRSGEILSFLFCFGGAAAFFAGAGAAVFFFADKGLAVWRATALAADFF